MVQGDYDDVSSMRKAFSGARAIFVVTDFMAVWTKTSESEELKKRAEAKGLTINEYARDWEIDQGVKIAKAASDPEILVNLEKYVFSTLTGIKNATKGRYPHACQFDSKAAIEDHVRGSLPELSKRMSTVNMGAYQENVIDPEQPAFTPHKAEDGSYYFVKLKSAGAHDLIPELWTYQDAGVFVDALIRQHPAGTHALGGSEMISKEDYAAKWGLALGKKAYAKELDDQALRAILPKEFEDEVFEWFHFVREYGYTGRDDRWKTPAELGIHTTPLEEFFKTADWAPFL